MEATVKASIFTVLHCVRKFSLKMTRNPFLCQIHILQTQLSFFLLFETHNQPGSINQIDKFLYRCVHRQNPSQKKYCSWAALLHMNTAELSKCSEFILQKSTFVLFSLFSIYSAVFSEVDFCVVDIVFLSSLSPSNICLCFSCS